MSTAAQTPVVGLIGAGKVGTTLARLWFAAGVRIGALASRTPDHAAALAAKVQAVAVIDPAEVVARCELIVLSVPDDALADVTAQLVSCDWRGKAVIHTSGAHNRHRLDALAQVGAWTGSLHPAFPFADVESALHKLQSVGGVFALELPEDAAGSPLAGWLNGLLAATGSTGFTLSPEAKTLYHTALVIASNYTVTLYAAAARLLADLAIPSTVIDTVLSTLLQGTVNNLVTVGSPAALTGPLVRRDAGTITQHLATLQQHDPDLAELYRLLARHTLPLLLARGIPTAELLPLL